MPSIKFSKYFKIELIFFITYFYVFRFLTDFEYNFWEMKTTGISFFQVEYNLLHGTVSLTAFWVFYQLVKKYLFHKRTISFILCSILFLIGYSIYTKVTSYVFMHLDFLSAETRKFSSQQFHSKAIGFSFAYMFREFFALSFLAYFIHVDLQSTQMKALKEQQLISELTYLKAQLQPHFFFNTLNNIYSLALRQSKDTAPLVAKLAEMMRYILYKADEKFVPLTDEITFISNYVEVEAVRYRAAIKIDFDVQGIKETSKISPLLLLPFIENAFKHGVQEEDGQGFVNIIICESEEELMMEVTNSIASKNEKDSGGIGLINVQKRLEILYSGKYKLEIQNDGKIFHISLTLQIR